MIPQFPNFTRLTFDNKQEIESYTSLFPPYSDFNFVSLWVWNMDNEIELSILNENLVIKFQDYLNSEFFYSFIGNNKVLDTITELITFSANKGLAKHLKLLPEHNFLNCDIEEFKKKIVLTEDINNFDYILDAEKLSQMSGHTLHHKRKQLNNFLKNYNAEVVNKMIDTPNVQEEIIEFFYHWEKIREKQREDTKNELEAIKRLFTTPQPLPVTIQCVYIMNKLVGYTIFEYLGNEYTVSDFQKGDFAYKGIYEFLYFSMADYLLKKGCKFINIEQDLGVPGLRRSKKDYDPVYLKKYLVELR